MNLLDFIGMAFKRLRSRLLETLVIIIAIGLGTGVISMALGLRFAVQDMQRTIPDEYQRTIHLRSGEQFMREEEIVSLGQRIPEPARFTLGLVYEIKDNSPAVDYVFVNTGSSLQLSDMEPRPDPEDQEQMEQWFQRREEDSLQVQATMPDEINFREWKLASGNFFTDQDIKEASRVIILGAGAAERFFPDQNPVGQKIEVLHQEPYQVIGVLESLDYQDETFFSYQNQRLHYGGIVPFTSITMRTVGSSNDDIMDREVHGITAAVDDIDRVEQAVSQINTFLEREFREGFNVSSFGGIAEARDRNIRAMLIAGLVASLGLLIAAINILNLMLARVLRRTKDLGVIKALGSTRRSIFKIFLTEALLLGLFGAVLGYGLAYGGEILINSLTENFFITIDYRVFLSAFAVSGFVSLLFGVYPAIQASGINPVEALRIE